MTSSLVENAIKRVAAEALRQGEIIGFERGKAEREESRQLIEVQAKNVRKLRETNAQLVRALEGYLLATTGADPTLLEHADKMARRALALAK